jgi:hypothetical protein
MMEENPHPGPLPAYRERGKQEYRERGKVHRIQY